jgi:hypothetical protein
VTYRPATKGEMMTEREMMDMVYTIFPEAIFDQDSNGEITISTGMMFDVSGDLVGSW